MTTDSAAVAAVDRSWRIRTPADARLVVWLQYEWEQERRWLADRLDDDPVQILSHVARLLQSVEGIDQAPAEVREATALAGKLAAGVGSQLRHLASELRPPLLDDLGLGAALAQLVREHERSTGMPSRFLSGGIAGSRGPAVDLALYRVVQATLHQAQQSRSAGVDVRLEGREVRQVRITILDHGPRRRGSAVSELASALALAGQCLAALGGRLTVSYLPGCGGSLLAEADRPHLQHR
ncbi:MAG: sensor histidine kinase [Candidatus Dormibacteria bacterium]